jgi:hypothetical protein
LWAGLGVCLVKRIEGAAEIVHETVEEARSVFRSCGALLASQLGRGGCPQSSLQCKHLGAPPIRALEGAKPPRVCWASSPAGSAGPPARLVRGVPVAASLGYNVPRVQSRTATLKRLEEVIALAP